MMIRFLSPIDESGCSLKWQIKRLYWSGVRNWGTVFSIFGYGILRAIFFGVCWWSVKKWKNCLSVQTRDFLTWTEGSLPYRCINNTSVYTLNGLDRGFASIGLTIIISNRWWHPMKTPFLLCCLPFRKADDTASPSLQGLAVDDGGLSRFV